jgi:hypothetical protein
MAAVGGSVSLRVNRELGGVHEVGEEDRGGGLAGDRLIGAQSVSDPSTHPLRTSCQSRFGLLIGLCASAVDTLRLSIIGSLERPKPTTLASSPPMISLTIR